MPHTVQLGAAPQRTRHLELVASFIVDEVPYALRFALFALSADGVKSVGTIAPEPKNTTPLLGTWVLSTSAAPSAPSVTLRPQHPLHFVARALKLVHEIEIGDRVVDSLFLIAGDADLLKATLRGPLREALLGVAAYDVPTVTLGPGVCTMQWAYETTDALLGHAVTALRFLRALEGAGEG